MIIEKVILVDENDDPVGECEKLEAHRNGLLHRAFSVFIFNHKGDMLLQKRAAGKYHSPSLWSNACCGHPRPGEETISAGQRRLKEELGIHCELQEKYNFIYRVKFENGLAEHEFDHILVGYFDGKPQPDPAEASDWKTIAVNELMMDLQINPGNYTHWFKLCMNDLDKFNLI